MKNKKCTKCEQIYPKTTKYWHRCSKANDGLQYTCKICRQENQRRYLQTDRGKEKKKEWNKKAKYVMRKIRAERRIKSQCINCGAYSERTTCQNCSDKLKDKVREKRKFIKNPLNKKITNVILYNLMQDYSITPTLLAGMIAVTPRSVLNWLMDGIMPSLENQKKVAKFFKRDDIF